MKKYTTAVVRFDEEDSATIQNMIDLGIGKTVSDVLRYAVKQVAESYNDRDETLPDFREVNHFLALNEMMGLLGE